MRFRRLVLLGIASMAALGLPGAAARADDFNSKDGHTLGLGATVGLPQLLSAEVRIVSVKNFEFGVGLGAFPANQLAQSLYSFSPIPINLQTGDTYNIYPSATYSLSGIYAFARWFPWGRGWYMSMSLHSLSLSASISGTLKDETLGTSVTGALDASVGITQPMVDIGPGYQFLIGEHFHVDLGLGLLFLLPASSSVSIGGSLSSFVVLNSTAQTNYDNAKSSLVNAVNQAMSNYDNSLKFLPSFYLTLGYLL